MVKRIQLDKETVIQLYHKDNLTLEQVANKTGVSRDTIRRNMRLYDISSKPPEVYRKGQDNRIIALLPKAKEFYYEQEISFGEVCQRLNVSFYTLKRLFNDNNLELRNSSEVIKLAYRKYPSMGFKTGNLHPRFNGYRTYETKTGYVRVYNPNHPRSGVNGYIFEHILVWEQFHGIPLPEGWTIHHLNGIKNDNRIENLVGMSSRAHRFILTEKAKRIRFLESKNKELEKSLLEATKMYLP